MNITNIIKIVLIIYPHINVNTHFMRFLNIEIKVKWYTYQHAIKKNQDMITLVKSQNTTAMKGGTFQ